MDIKTLVSSWCLYLIIEIFQITQAAPTEGSNHCGHKVADVVFALDTSGSIWEEDFVRQLKFVEDVVQQFPVGADKVRVGLITFGSKVFQQFYLNEYYQKKSLVYAIKDVQYVGGGTNTEAAIAHARNVMFKTINGGRDNVDKIVIVITDGYSRNTTQTALEASISKSLGIKMFSVGVGYGVDDFELNAIANRPTDDSEKFTFRVDDFNALDSIKSALTTKACEAMPSNVKQNDEAIQEEHMEKDIRKYCGGKPADVYFVIDASSSISEHNFRKMLRFVSEVIELFDLGTDRTRVGIVVFSDGIHPIIHISNEFSRAELKRRIMEAPFLKGGTRTGSAIQYVRQRGFSREHARRNVAHVAIILTDGQSAQTSKTIAEAKRAQKDGIYLFAIGIGDQIDRHELKAIASEPAEDFLFEMDNFDALPSIKTILAIETCSAPDLQQDQKQCQLKSLDVMYVFDSYSMGQKKTNIILDFVTEMIQLSNNKNERIKSGVIMQSCNHHQDTPLASYNDVQSFVSSVSTTQSKGLTGLLKKLRHHGYQLQNGGRYEAQNVAVLIVDSSLTNYKEVQMEARRVKFRNRIEVFLVVIGELKSNNDFKSLCSEPVSNHFITVPDYSALSTLTSSLFSKFCEVDPILFMSQKKK